MVKGWAVQRASALLHTLAETDFCLSAGGDMVCRLGDPDVPAWQIGIEDPFDPTRIVARIPVRHGAVATSGHTHRGAHIVDARSGRPPHGIASVTVIAENLTWADIDCTAAFALGVGAIDWLGTRPGRHGIVVWADGTPQIFQSRSQNAPLWRSPQGQWPQETTAAWRRGPSTPKPAA